MTSTQNKTSSISNVIRVFSRARAMPGLRPHTRDIANPKGRDRHNPGRALQSLMDAMSATPEQQES